MGWIWSKSVSFGKKILTACIVITSAPFVVPPLAVATVIAMISSLPYCALLACYVCTEKLMRILLPSTNASFSGRCDDDDHDDDNMMPLMTNKIGYGDDIYRDGIARVAMMRKPVLVYNEEEGSVAIERRNLRVINNEDEEIMIESKSLLESIRDEDIKNQSLDRGVLTKNGLQEEENYKVRARLEDVSRKKQESVTRHEGELESSTTKASKGKDTEKSSNEMKVLYSEKQIWAKMEALREMFGYKLAKSTSYTEELKALYMFTGVKLPTSSMLSENENEDIAQVSESLCFLMSVIGIE
ncbi:unnamed protein product [Cochlearia groenlandica]